MKKAQLILMVLVLVPAVLFGGGLEDILKQIVVSKVKDPQAKQILGAVLHPKADLHVEYVGNYPDVIEPGEMYQESANDLISRGKSLGNAGRVVEALACFRQAIALEPENVDAHYCAGIAYARLGDKRSAVEEYRVIQQLSRVINYKMDKLSKCIGGYYE